MTKQKVMPPERLETLFLAITFAIEECRRIITTIVPELSCPSVPRLFSKTPLLAWVRSSRPALTSRA